MMTATSAKMVMKIYFEQPKVEIIQFDFQEIITTSVRFGSKWAGDKEEIIIFE